MNQHIHNGLLCAQELGCFVISSRSDTDQTLTFMELSDDLITVPFEEKFD